MVKRGDLYRVLRPTKKDPKRFRILLVVGRQEVIESTYSTVICAPVYSNCLGIETEVEITIDEGLKHNSCVRCDELISVHKSDLTNYIGKLSNSKLDELNRALKIALVIT